MSILSFFTKKKLHPTYLEFLASDTERRSQEYDRKQSENEQYLREIQAEEERIWSLWQSTQGKVHEGWKNYIAALRIVYPDKMLFDSMPGFSLQFRKARAVLIDDDPFFRLRYRPNFPEGIILDVGERAIQYGFLKAFPEVDPNKFNILSAA